MSRAVALLAGFAMLPAAATIAVAEPGRGEAPVNWPQFRGPDGLPTSAEPGLPLSWTRSENVEWVAEVPGVGWSSPIVWDGRVFVTTAVASSEMKPPSLGVDFSNDFVAELVKEGKSEEEIRAAIYARDMEMPDEVELSYRLYCFELATGSTLWEREFHQGAPPVGRHRKNSYTSETPVTDGERVYVYVAHLGLWAFDLRGEPQWHVPLEAHQVYLDFGGGASPALAGDLVVIQNDNEDASFIAAFDKRTGERAWYTERPGLGTQQKRSGWSTPYYWKNDEQEQIVTLAPGAAIAYDLEGQEIWRLGRLANAGAQSPFAWEGAAYLASGSGGGDDRPLVAVEPGARGDITPAEGAEGGEHLVWFDRIAGGSYLPTPVVYDGRIYVLTDKGIFSAHDARTGERLYKTRIHPRARNFTSSPWAYAGHVFCINEEGETFVIKAGDAFELVGTNALDGFTQATPALAGDRLLIRTQDRLYSIRANRAEVAPAS